MKIAYISPHRNPKTYKILKKEAKKLGLEIESKNYQEFKTNLIKNFDFFILRDPNFKMKNYSKERRRILKKLNKKNTLDFNTLTAYPNHEDKLFQYKFFKKFTRIPKTYYFNDKNKIKIDSFPIMVKKRISSRGKQDFKIDSQKKLQIFLKDKKIKDYIIEKYIKPKQDLRILILNKKILATVERKPVIKKRRDYSKIGVKVSNKFKLNKILEKEALKISKRIKSDLCGIDFILDENNKSYFLECNISPQFIATERVSKEHISKQLLNFIKKQNK